MNSPCGEFSNMKAMRIAFSMHILSFWPCFVLKHNSSTQIFHGNHPWLFNSTSTATATNNHKITEFQQQQNYWLTRSIKKKKRKKHPTIFFKLWPSPWHLSTSICSAVLQVIHSLAAKLTLSHFALWSFYLPFAKLWGLQVYFDLNMNQSHGVQNVPGFTWLDFLSITNTRV